jgi:subtilase family serine protease
MTKSDMRTVPDVSAHAASGPGWVLFSGEGEAVSASLVGGTSAATPFTAAAVGIIAATERLAGQPSFGLIQPALYDMYAQHPESVHDVTVGGNDLFDKGCCSARVGYDTASGMGVPKFEHWYQHLPRE